MAIKAVSMNLLLIGENVRFIPVTSRRSIGRFHGLE